MSRKGKGSLCISCYYLCSSCLNIPFGEREWVKEYKAKKCNAGDRGYYAYTVLGCERYRNEKYRLEPRAKWRYYETQI